MRLATISLTLVLATSAFGQPPTPRTQVRFAGPSAMQIRWLYRGVDGKEAYSDPPLEVPARYAFRQGGLYRLKLSHIPGYPGLELFPTLEVPLQGSEGQEFLAHNAVKLELTNDEIRDAMDGKQVRKTITLPRDDATAGPILLILRLGNVDLGK